MGKKKVNALDALFTKAKKKAAKSQSRAEKLLNTKTKSVAQVKRELAFREDEIPDGTLVRDHISAVVRTERFKCCNTQRETVISLEIVFRTKSGKMKRDLEQGQIKTNAGYRFNLNLPVKVRHVGVEYPPVCANCLEKENANYRCVS